MHGLTNPFWPPGHFLLWFCQLLMWSLPPLADSKQNGEANVVLSDEEQPLSPGDEEKRPMRRSSTRDKNKKSSTCFLLATGDFSCAADGGIQKGTAGGVSRTWGG